MSKTIKRTILAAIAAGLLACCSVSRLWAPPVGLPVHRTLVILIDGWGEVPGQSCLTPIACRLRLAGYEVREFRYDDELVWKGTRPVVVIGFSYGGDAACRASFSQRIDHLILLNPTREGNVLRQGEPLLVHDSVGDITIYATGDIFPCASRLVIRSPRNGFQAGDVISMDRVIKARMVPHADHTGIVAKVEEKIVNSFDSL